MSRGQAKVPGLAEAHESEDPGMHASDILDYVDVAGTP